MSASSGRTVTTSSTNTARDKQLLVCSGTISALVAAMFVPIIITNPFHFPDYEYDFLWNAGSISHQIEWAPGVAFGRKIEWGVWISQILFASVAIPGLVALILNPRSGINASIQLMSPITQARFYKLWLWFLCFWTIFFLLLYFVIIVLGSNRPLLVNQGLIIFIQMIALLLLSAISAYSVVMTPFLLYRLPPASTRQLLLARKRARIFKKLAQVSHFP